MAVGHHRRLDKATPTELWDGALLAFGAPHDWWRLSRDNYVLVPSRLSQAERSRLLSIADITSCEIGDTWTEESTHLVTDCCSSSSIKFLTVLAEGKHVVNTAWTEALRHVVVESCRANTEAPEGEARAKASELPDEKRFVPPFSPADQAVFTAEELTAVFEDKVQERRKNMFKNIKFAFSREERRSRWVTIVEALGGSTTLAKAITSSHPLEGIVFVQGEQGASKKASESLETLGRTFLPESALGAAIIRADLESLKLESVSSGDASPSMVKSNAAEITDVATPGPLDSESDVDSDESDTANERRKAAGRSGDPMDIVDAIAEVDGIGRVAKSKSRPLTKRGAPTETKEKKESKDSHSVELSRAAPLSLPSKKRARPLSGSSLEGSGSPQSKRNAISVSEEPADGVEKVHVTASVTAEPIDNSDLNERAFFPVETVNSSADAPGGSVEAVVSSAVGSSVRPFRRRKLPQADAIPVKLVRYVETTERDFERPRLHSEARYRRRRGQDGAEVLSSEEE